MAKVKFDSIKPTDVQAGDGPAPEPVKAPDAPVTPEPQMSVDPASEIPGTIETRPDGPDLGVQVDPQGAVPVTKGGKLKQAYTDDATGQTYLPGEKVGNDE